MAFVDHFPLAESLGVFVGVSSFEWLAEGQAELMNALLAAAVGGGIISAARRLKQRRNRKD